MCRFSWSWRWWILKFLLHFLALTPVFPSFLPSFMKNLIHHCLNNLWSSFLKMYSFYRLKSYKQKCRMCDMIWPIWSLSKRDLGEQAWITDIVTGHTNHRSIPKVISMLSWIVTSSNTWYMNIVPPIALLLYLGIKIIRGTVFFFFF